MSLQELKEKLKELSITMDDSISLVTDAAAEAQEAIFKAITTIINNFEITDGRFVVTQNYAARLIALEQKIKKILGDVYAPSISEYLNTFTTIEDANIALQKGYNQIEVETGLLSPAKKGLMNQAAYYLDKGLADAYIQPAKFLIMQQVTTGISLRDSLKILSKWNEGEYKAPTGRQTPNLQKYAVQVARDSLFQWQGTIQDTIGKRYDLTDFIYVGDIIEDSRPLCRHLVEMQKKQKTISLDEIPALVKQFPQGTIPGTNKENFPVYRGGRNCRHTVMMVRKRN